MKYLITLFYLLSTLPAHAALNEVDKAFIATQNILKNPGFENGKQSWTGTDMTDVAVVSSGSNLLTGLGSVTWNSDGAAQNFRSVAVAIPKGLYGRNGVAACVIQTPSGTATHTLGAYDGSVSLVSTAVTSSTIPTRNSANFIFPSSGNIQLEFLSVAADEPLIAIDDCYLGPSEGYNTGSVSQAMFIGEASFPTTTNCIFTRTSTSLGSMTDTDCTGPTVLSNPGPGTIQTTDTNNIDVTLNNLPPGRYRVVFNGGTIQAGTDTSTISFAVSDGTTTKGTVGAGNSDSEITQVAVEANFEYTTAGNRTFSLYGSASSGVVNLNIGTANRAIYFAIYRYPLTSEQAYTPDKVANSWSGYHDNTCSFTNTGATFDEFTADASCGLTTRTSSNMTVSTSGSVLPAITFTPSRAGRYWVCASPEVATVTSNNNISVQLTDGTTAIAESNFRVYTDGSSSGRSKLTVCGIHVASSTSAQTISLYGAAASGTITIAAGGAATSAIEWSIFQIDQSLPAPLLVNSVVNPYSGVTQTASAIINCDGSSAITSQNGSWVSSVGNISTGVCTVTLAAGTFSATPICVSNYYVNTSSNAIVSNQATSSTSVSVGCRSDTGSSCAAFDFNLICMGPK